MVDSTLLRLVNAHISPSSAGCGDRDQHGIEERRGEERRGM